MNPLFLVTALFPLLFASDLPLDVQSFLKTTDSHFFHSKNSNLHAHYYSQNAKSPMAVVFIPGMGEPALKYYDLKKDLHLEQPIAFYWWDPIGQGFSSHLIAKELEKTHIDSFATQISVFKDFLTQIRKRHAKVLLIGHSMGGHLALRLTVQNPGLVDALILSSPMIDINRTWVPVYLLASLLPWLPGTFFPPLHFLFVKYSERGGFVTHDKKKMKIYKQMVSHFPQIKRSGATLGWLKAALESITELRKTDLTKFNIPTLLLQAEKDYLVSNQAQNEFCEKIINCTKVTIPGAKHEILFEEDDRRQTAILQIRELIKLLQLKTERQ